jgi:hypothetical protein
MQICGNSRSIELLNYHSWPFIGIPLKEIWLLRYVYSFRSGMWAPQLLLGRIPSHFSRPCILICSLIEKLTDCFIDRSIDWLTDWLVKHQTDCVIDIHWSTNRLTAGPPNRIVGWLTVRLIDSHIDFPTDRSTEWPLAGWPASWLAGLLADGLDNW